MYCVGSIGLIYYRILGIDQAFFKGMHIRISILSPVKGRVVINHGSYHTAH